MFLTGPKVVKTVTGEDIDAEHLGGASVHAGKSGVTSFTAKTEEDAMQQIRTLLSYIPSNNTEEAPRVECTDPIDRKEDLLNDILPDDPNKAYDMYKVIKAITDNGDFFEVQPKFAKNIITGFARFNGQSVGIVANQPAAYAGVLDVNASRKGARFVRFCDAFNIPIVSLVDVPGFLPGTGQEYNAVILHGAQLLFAYGEATVPKITINLRKSYGGSHIVMGCKQLRADLNFAWPTAEIAVMGASGAVAVLCGKEAKKIKEEGGDVKWQRRKTSTQKPLPILIRQLSLAISMMSSSHATPVSAFAVAWLSWLTNARIFPPRSMAACRCNQTFQYSEDG